MLDLTPDEVLATTRSVRKRLDFDRPVAPSTIQECIELALQAPTGSNRQTWQWMVIMEADRKAQIAKLYASSWYAYAGLPRPEYPAGDPRREQGPRVIASARYLADNFHRVPAMVIPLVAGRLDELTTSKDQAGSWGSILPAAWSFMLALRARGLASAWTTLHLEYEREAAELLGIPYAEWTQAGLFPVAYSIGTEFKRAERLPAADLIHWDTW